MGTLNPFTLTCHYSNQLLHKLLLHLEPLHVFPSLCNSYLAEQSQVDWLLAPVKQIWSQPGSEEQGTVAGERRHSEQISCVYAPSITHLKIKYTGD